MRQTFDHRKNSYAPRGLRRESAANWVGLSPTKFDELAGKLKAGNVEAIVSTLNDFQIIALIEALKKVSYTDVYMLGGDTIKTTLMLKGAGVLKGLYATSPIPEAREFTAGAAFLFQAGTLNAGADAANPAALAGWSSVEVAPSGVSGVHRVPNAGHAVGLMRPCKTSPLRHSPSSAVWICATSKRVSASNSAKSSDSRQPEAGNSPMPSAASPCSIWEERRPSPPWKTPSPSWNTALDS